MSAALEPRHVRPQQWREAIDVARETCARFFRDGRSPADAVRAFGLVPSEAAGWSGAVNAIAEAVCAGPAPLQRWREQAVLDPPGLDRSERFQWVAGQRSPHARGALGQPLSGTAS
jgi:hypothetical protein